MFQTFIIIDVCSAEDWNLAKPIATCSLIVIRRDNALLIRLLAEKEKEGGPTGATEKYLFAQCSAELDFTQVDESEECTTKRKLRPNKMEHWVESVVDSSRYFAVRISDENTGREANIGMGFRERNDALNFKMSLQDYENAMRKEGIVSCLDYSEKNKAHSTSSPENDTSSTEPIMAVSNLSLKEGEKIHVNLKGTSRARARKNQSGDANASGKSLLLRKPPPPASSFGDSGAAVVVNTDALRNDKSTSTSGDNNASNELSSVAAVAETIDVDDEWGDFEGP